MLGYFVATGQSPNPKVLKSSSEFVLGFRYTDLDALSVFQSFPGETFYWSEAFLGLSLFPVQPGIRD